MFNGHKISTFALFLIVQNKICNTNKRYRFRGKGMKMAWVLGKSKLVLAIITALCFSIYADGRGGCRE